MEFGSKFVYNYSDSEEECVSDDEYEGGMDAEMDAPAGPPTAPPPALAPPLPPPRPTSDLVYASVARKPKALMDVSDDEHHAPRSASCDLAPALPKRQEPTKSRVSGLFGKLFSGSHGSSKTVDKPASRPPPPKLSKKIHHWMSEGARPQQMGKGAGMRGHKWRRADTNVVAIKFDKLRSPSHMHTGDPTYCQQCRSLLSHLSKITSEEEEKVWQCEFCGTRNVIDVMDEEIPKQDDVTYMLSPAPSTVGGGRSGADESVVVFCIDTSGSMCVTTEVSGKVRLRGDRTKELQRLNTDREDQRLPGQRRDVTYVSRLQSVQAAVDHQLAAMAKEHPDRRVCLVTFSSDVTVFGDGSDAPVHFSGDKLQSWEEMRSAGGGLGLPKAVKLSRATLGEKVFQLEEGGQTALGPALLLSVAMACQVPGSKVILCTDGMANIGLGSLEHCDQEDALDNASAFYTEVSTLAKDQGVAVSLTTIKGTDCKLVELGGVADVTGGQVNVVDPLKLTEEFGSILADPIIATNVTATMLLHKGLYFRNEESRESSVTRHVGNVTKETEVTFEYGVRPEWRRKRKENVYAPEPETIAETSIDVTAETSSGTTAQTSSGATAQTSSGAAAETSSGATAETSSGATAETSSGATAETSSGAIAETSSGATAETSSGATAETSSGATAETSSGATAETSSGATTETSSGATAETSSGATAETSSGATAETSSGATAETSSGATAQTSAGTRRSIGELSELPFQLCIAYTDLEGAKALRVLSHLKPVTTDRGQAEREVNAPLIGAHAAQTTANMALRGRYKHSRLNAFMYQRLVHRQATENVALTSDYDMYCSNIRPVETYINRQQMCEREMRGRSYSDDEADDLEGVPVDECPQESEKVSRKKAKEATKNRLRRMETSDEGASVLYSTKNISSSKFK